MSDSFKTFFHLLQHIFIAAVLFCAVALVAILLWYGTVKMEHFGVPDDIRITCHYVAEFLFWSDTFCLVVYALSEIVKWLIEIIQSFRAE